MSINQLLSFNNYNLNCQDLYVDDDLQMGPGSTGFFDNLVVSGNFVSKGVIQGCTGIMTQNILPCGINPIVVHGYGPPASNAPNQLDIQAPTTFENTAPIEATNISAEDSVFNGFVLDGGTRMGPIAQPALLDALTMVRGVFDIIGIGSGFVGYPTALSIIQAIQAGIGYNGILGNFPNKVLPENGTMFTFIVYNSSGSNTLIIGNNSPTDTTQQPLITQNVVIPANTSATFTGFIIDNTGVMQPSIIIYSVVSSSLD